MFGEGAVKVEHFQGYINYTLLREEVPEDDFPTIYHPCTRPTLIMHIFVIDCLTALVMPVSGVIYSTYLDFFSF
jgi:hypothetical protein